MSSLFGGRHSNHPWSRRGSSYLQLLLAGFSDSISKQLTWFWGTVNTASKIHIQQKMFLLSLGLFSMSVIIRPASCYIPSGCCPLPTRAHDWSLKEIVPSHARFRNSQGWRGFTESPITSLRGFTGSATKIGYKSPECFGSILLDPWRLHMRPT